MNPKNQCGHKRNARQILQGPVTGRWTTKDRQLLTYCTRNYWREKRGPLSKVILHVYIQLFKFLCRGLSQRDPRLRHPKYREYFPPEVLQVVLGKVNSSDQDNQSATRAATKEYTVTNIDHSTEVPNHRPKKSILKKSEEKRRSSTTCQNADKAYRPSNKRKRRLRPADGEVDESGRSIGEPNTVQDEADKFQDQSVAIQKSEVPSIDKFRFIQKKND